MENKIAVFFHNAIMGNHEEVEKEIMNALKESGLLERADIFIKTYCKDIGLYEFPTLEMLDQFAIYHPDYYILYIMNKGVSRPQLESMKDWRECMTYWNIEKWKDCVKKLDDGYDAVGINVVDSPVRHFQGNWWWVKAEHIKKLGIIPNVSFKPVPGMNMTERHKAEFWVLSKPALVYCPYHHRINPYMTNNPRKNYEKKSF
jgi:hypothetical protein